MRQRLDLSIDFTALTEVEWNVQLNKDDDTEDNSCLDLHLTEVQFSTIRPPVLLSSSRSVSLIFVTMMISRKTPHIYIYIYIYIYNGTQCILTSQDTTSYDLTIYSVPISLTLDLLEFVNSILRTIKVPKLQHLSSDSGSLQLSCSETKRHNSETRKMEIFLSVIHYPSWYMESVSFAQHLSMDSVVYGRQFNVRLDSRHSSMEESHDIHLSRQQQVQSWCPSVDTIHRSSDNIKLVRQSQSFQLKYKVKFSFIERLGHSSNDEEVLFIFNLDYFKNWTLRERNMWSITTDCSWTSVPEQESFVNGVILKYSIDA